jgi:mutator protein MutT
VETIDVSAALIFRDGRLLIAQRNAEAHLGGLWEFPGGKREPGETFEQCLVRELREELGVVVTVGERLDTVEHEYPGRRVRIQFFRCRLQAGEPEARGCAALRWVRAAELEQFAFPEADARLLERLQRSPELWR